MENGQNPLWNLPTCQTEQLWTDGQKMQRETQKFPEQMGQPGRVGDEMAVIIIISQIPLVHSGFQSSFKSIILLESHNSSGQ